MTATLDTMDTTVAPFVLPERGGRAGVAALPALAAMTLAIAGFVIASDDGVHASDAVRGVLIVAWALASLSALRGPVRRVGFVVGGASLLAGVAYLGEALRVQGTGGTQDIGEFVGTVGCALLFAAGLHVLVALPSGTLDTSGRKGTVLFGYALAAIAGLAWWVGPGHIPSWGRWVGWLGAIALGLPAANRRYVATAGLERQRLQWIGCGGAIAIQAAVVVGALRLLVDWPGHAGPVAAAFTILLPAALAAGSSPRLVTRVDRLLVHTVSVAGLTAVVVVVYLVIVLGLGRAPDEPERQLLGLSMAAAAVAAILYLPARERLTDVANRLVYGERQAPDEVLRTFGSRLTRAIPMDELLLQLAESLKKTMALTKAEVWTGTGELLERSISVPHREPVKLALGETERPVVTRAGVSGTAWAAVWLPAIIEERPDAQIRVAPVTHSGELLGLIVAERPGDGNVFTEEDDRVLTELARQVGLALHNVQLDSALQATLDEVRRQAEELRASRARIVATGDAERRKIERNLHDGAQQHLVALAVNLRLTKDILTDDPESAAEMLDALADEVKATIQELRDLAHGIYPPLLMDSGLPEALRAAATRSPLDVSVSTDGVGRYPSELEAAIYFCCLEALQNAAKHAPEATVSVKVWEEAGGLLFEVVDNGPGFSAEVARQGHGYVNMSDRLGAIGGTVRWESVPGEGATVAGSVPLASVPVAPVDS